MGRGRGDARRIAAAIPQWSRGSLVPAARDLNLLLHLQTAEGTSLTEMNRVAGLMSAELRPVPGVEGVGGHGPRRDPDQLGDVNGRAVDHHRRLHRLRLDAGRHRPRGAAVPRGQDALSTYSADQVSAATTGHDQDLVVRVSGRICRTPADRTVRRDVLSAVDGVRSPRVAAAAMQPTVRVEVNLAAAERHGLRPGDIRREATTLASGLTVGNLYEQAKVFDVVVLGTPPPVPTSRLSRTSRSTPSGEQVRLGDVARLSVAPEPHHRARPGHAQRRRCR